MASWTAGKWVAYWLSTDQLNEPAESSRRSQIVHACGVIFCWLLLALACLGWWELKNLNPQFAALLLGYAVLMTMLHTPFVMNTRIRSPMIDPLIAILAGGSWLVFRARPDSRPTLIC